MTERCLTEKMGKFARLQCVLQEGHEGRHNFVTLGVKPVKPTNRKRSDAEYEKGRERAQKWKEGLMRGRS